MVVVTVKEAGNVRHNVTVLSLCAGGQWSLLKYTAFSRNHRSNTDITAKIGCIYVLYIYVYICMYVCMCVYMCVCV